MKRKPIPKKTPKPPAYPKSQIPVGGTLVSFLLDETGSMQSWKAGVLSGFQEYVETLQKQATRAHPIRFSLTKFNSEKTEVVHVATPIQEVKPLSAATYQPAATTPLYDAIGQTVRELEKAIVRAGKYLVVIMTDGLENASREWTRETVFRLIKEKEALGTWTFVYLGAAQEAWVAAEAMGINRGNTMRYDARQTAPVMARLARSTVEFTCGADAQTKDFYRAKSWSPRQQ